MKKIISFLLVVVMVLAFTACGASTTPSTSPDDSGSNGSPEEPSAD